jgi:hypothetical protein
MKMEQENKKQINTGKVIVVVLVIAAISALFVITPGCLQTEDCQEISEEYFPNRVGNWWVYDRFDSLTTEHSELRVEITEESVHRDGKKYTTWIFGMNNLYDTLYVRESGDSVLQYKYTDGSPMEVLILPLAAGQSWQHPVLFFDTTRVTDHGRIAIPAGVFDHSWLLTRNWYAFNEFMRDKRWIVPYIGIVRLERNHRLWGPISNETWELKNYGFAKQ